LETISSLLAWSKQELNNDSTSLDAQILLAHVLDCSRSYLIAYSNDEVCELAVNKFKQLINKRTTGYPLAYIIGKKEFWSEDFIVTEDVLIPRPDTETLVQAVLDNLDKSKNIKLCDFGTGSGAIACSLALECPNWKITAVDNQEKALKVAKANVAALNLNNVDCILSNWAQNINDKFDAIVSNPPYLQINDEFGDINLKFEPQIALVSGSSGLECIVEIIKQGKNLLNPNGMLAFEHGFNQAEQVKKLLIDNNFKDIQTIQDLSKLDRVTFGYAI
jgi:release factor glutamine methyltransferase